MKAVSCLNVEVYGIKSLIRELMCDIEGEETQDLTSSAKDIG